MADIASTAALGDDPIGGLITVTEGIVHYLTRCCGASAKGSAQGRTGVVCRACYIDVPAALGAAWSVEDTEAWRRYAESLESELGCYATGFAHEIHANAVLRSRSGATDI